MTQNTSLRSQQHERLLRKLGKVENERRIRQIGSTVVYNIVIRSSDVIKPEFVETSLVVIQQKYQTFRIGFVLRDGLQYFQEIEHSPIDFQVDTGHWEATYHALLRTPFSGSGPLWRARYIPPKPCQEDSARTSHILLSWSHSITDGFSCLTVCNSLLETLDSIISGEIPKITESIKLTPSMEDMIRNVYSRDTQSLGNGDDVVLDRNFPTDSHCGSWRQNFRDLNENKLETRLVRGGVLGSEKTRSLIQRCKREEVTVNSAIHAAIIRAIYWYNVKNLRIGEGEILCVKGAFDVNMRKYFEKKDVIGLYKTYVEAHHSVSAIGVENFWKDAKEVHKKMKQAMRFDALAMEILAEPKSEAEVNRISVRRQTDLVCCYDYDISNMGDVRSSFPGKYRNFEVPFYHHSTNRVDHGIAFGLNVETFRGKLRVNADVVPRVMSEQDVKTVLDRILYTLDNITSQ